MALLAPALSVPCARCNKTSPFVCLARQIFGIRPLIYLVLEWIDLNPLLDGVRILCWMEFQIYKLSVTAHILVPYRFGIQIQYNT